MRSTFPGFYKFTDEQFTALWENAILVFDASALLNLYTYSEGSRNAILGVLKNVSSHLWIPNQFAYEYQKNRMKVLREQRQHYENVATVLNGVASEVRRLSSFCRDRFVRDDLKKKLDGGVSGAMEEIAARLRLHDALLAEDPHHEMLSNLFHERVGSPPDTATTKERMDAADTRYRACVPPGYCDIEKKKEEHGHPYGDYFGWCEMLAHAEKNEKPMILVTDDRKPDWWLIRERRTIVSPRPELITEFRSRVKADFYMYTLDGFVRSSQKYERFRLDSSVVDEASERESAIRDVPLDDDDFGADESVATDSSAKAPKAMRGDGHRGPAQKSTRRGPDGQEKAKASESEKQLSKRSRSETAMAIIVDTERPARLLRLIREAIDDGTVRTWTYDDDGDLTLTSEQWGREAWFSPQLGEEKLYFAIVPPRGTRITRVVYAVYHSRLLEMLLTHFDNRFDDSRVTAQPMIFDNV